MPYLFRLFSSRRHNTTTDFTNCESTAPATILPSLPFWNSFRKSIWTAWTPKPGRSRKTRSRQWKTGTATWESKRSCRAFEWRCVPTRTEDWSNPRRDLPFKKSTVVTRLDRICFFFSSDRTTDWFLSQTKRASRLVFFALIFWNSSGDSENAKHTKHKIDPTKQSLFWETESQYRKGCSMYYYYVVDLSSHLCTHSYS